MDEGARQIGGSDAVSEIAAFHWRHRSSGSKMLKPGKVVRSISNSYNPLADLRGLSIFMFRMALIPAQSAMLCTSDANLALFWVGLHASDIRLIDQKLAYRVSLGEVLLPGATEQQIESIFPDA